MKKTSIHFICPDLWASTAGLLQSLIVMQQCVYCLPDDVQEYLWIQEATDKAWIGLEQNTIDTACCQ